MQVFLLQIQSHLLYQQYHEILYIFSIWKSTIWYRFLLVRNNIKRASEYSSEDYLKTSVGDILKQIVCQIIPQRD
jgi:hypothetical protein